jgi:anti-sigma factor ChrR (cupin superfamily)
MAAVMKEADKIKVLGGAASQAPWINCGPGIQIKVLAVDLEHHAVQYLARTGPGHNPGVHRHNADASIFILEGSVKNLTTGCEFGPGDFCFQPTGDVHEEVVGPEGVVSYVSQRGDSDLLIEFFDETGAVGAKYSVSDFAKML